MNKSIFTGRVSLSVLISSIALMCWVLTARAEKYPIETVASPEVYKVIAEDADFRVILATWAPGKKDAMHSHEHKFVAVVLNKCHRTLTSLDGKIQEKNLKPGKALIKKPVKGHVFENIGKTVCRVMLVEKKR